MVVLVCWSVIFLKQQLYSSDIISVSICAMVKSRYIGDGHPTFNRNPYNGHINPYYWVDEFIPYYMEIMGV